MYCDLQKSNHRKNFSVYIIGLYHLKIFCKIGKLVSFVLSPSKQKPSSWLLFGNVMDEMLILASCSWTTIRLMGDFSTNFDKTFLISPVTKVC